MNLKQRLVLWAGLVLIAQIGLYPPWIQHFKSFDITLEPTAGVHYWIFSPPGPPVWVWNKGDQDLKIPLFWSAHLDVARITAELATVVIVFGGLIWSLQDRRTKAIPARN